MAKNYLVKLVILLVFLELVSSKQIDWKQVHKLLTPEDHMRIFKTDDIHKVSKYDVVTINWPKLQKRSPNEEIPLSLPAFNDEIKLNLKRIVPPIGLFTPVYFLYTSSSRLNYTIEYPFISYFPDIYEDEEHLASLSVVKGEFGETYIQSGVIGARNLTIHRLPSHLGNGRNSRSLTSGTNFYIIQYVDGTDEQFSNPIISNYTISNILDDSDLSMRDTIFPEILPILDYSLTSKFPENVDLFDYIVTFWSRVDMFYRSLSSPMYKLSISGLAVVMDESALKFTKVVNNSVDFESILNGAEKWLFEHMYIIPTDSYDVAIIQTSMKSTAVEVEEDGDNIITKSNRGLSELNGACRVDYLNLLVKKAGIIYDDAKYNGVLTAAHELGHTLGAQHDPENCGGNKSGFIMTELTKPLSSNQYSWSECTLTDFKNFLNTNPQCLYNFPNMWRNEKADLWSDEYELDLEDD